jgi:hypothetical protein
MKSQIDFDTTHNISVGKHFYQFYKSVEDFFQVMIPFFQAGLERGEAGLWIVSEKIGLDNARETASALLSNFNARLETGAFKLVRAEGWYLREGSFSEIQATINLKKHFEMIDARGFMGLRAAGDTAVIPASDRKAFNHYESNISGWLRNQSIVALCAYPILECTPSQTREILQFHDDVLVGKL